jgi:hypothetical protein
MGVLARTWKWMKEHYIWTIILVIVLLLLGIFTTGIGIAVVGIGLWLTSRAIKTRKVVTNANTIYLNLYAYIYDMIRTHYNSKNRDSLVKLNGALINMLHLYIKDKTVWGNGMKLALKQAFKLKKSEVSKVYGWVMENNASMFNALDDIIDGKATKFIDVTPSMNFDKFQTDMNMKNGKTKIMYNLAVAYFIAYVCAKIGYMNIIAMNMGPADSKDIDKVNKIRIEAIYKHNGTVLSNVSLIVSLINMKITKTTNVENIAANFKSMNSGAMKKYFEPMANYMMMCKKLGDLGWYRRQLDKSEKKEEEMKRIDKNLEPLLKDVERIDISILPMLYPPMVGPFNEKNALAPIEIVGKTTGKAVIKKKVVKKKVIKKKVMKKKGAKAGKGMTKKKCKGGQCKK